MSKKERLVAAIENGTVIDHIPGGQPFTAPEALHTRYYRL